jgi:hypothetical protein
MQDSEKVNGNGKGTKDEKGKGKGKVTGRQQTKGRGKETVKGTGLLIIHHEEMISLVRFLPAAEGHGCGRPTYGWLTREDRF